jgi:pimeloyl-ACP methyl ester carboxylesterase
MSDISHRFVETNGIRMHLAEQGSGPLVVLLHGFPELWYSWRHQLGALAEAGYHVVAPDQRGYGQSDRPSDARAYTQLHLVGDVIGLLDALGEQQAVVVGHDWGAPVAWNTALLRPDRVRGVVGLSVPYRPRGPVSTLKVFRSRFGEGFYQVYFQEPGKAEAELERDVQRTMRRLLYGASGAVEPPPMVVPPGSGLLDTLAESPALPAWLTPEDLEVFVSEFARTGFSGGLNWYRCIDLSWELMAAWQGAPVTRPALYVAGERDVVVSWLGEAPSAETLQAALQPSVPNLRGVQLLPGCGHWTQQERPAEVNAALLEFLRSL